MWLLQGGSKVDLSSFVANLEQYWFMLEAFGEDREPTAPETFMPLSFRKLQHAQVQALQRHQHQLDRIEQLAQATAAARSKLPSAHFPTLLIDYM